MKTSENIANSANENGIFSPDPKQDGFTLSSTTTTLYPEKNGGSTSSKKAVALPQYLEKVRKPLIN